MAEDTQNSTESRARAKPDWLKDHQFKPGKSGNPGGRPKGLGQAIRKLTEEGKVLVEFWMELVEGKIAHAPMKDRVAASRLLAEHGFGKPVQVIADPNGDPVDMNFNLTILSDGELDDLERAIDKITVPHRN